MKAKDDPKARENLLKDLILERWLVFEAETLLGANGDTVKIEMRVVQRCWRVKKGISADRMEYFESIHRDAYFLDMPRIPRPLWPIWPTVVAAAEGTLPGKLTAEMLSVVFHKILLKKCVWLGEYFPEWYKTLVSLRRCPRVSAFDVVVRKDGKRFIAIRDSERYTNSFRAVSGEFQVEDTALNQFKEVDIEALKLGENGRILVLGPTSDELHRGLTSASTVIREAASLYVKRQSKRLKALNEMVKERKNVLDV